MNSLRDEHQSSHPPSARKAGPLFSIEFLAAAALLAMFLTMFLPTYAAVRHLGGGFLAAVGLGILGGIILDFAFVAVPCVMLRILVRRDARRRHPRA